LIETNSDSDTSDQVEGETRHVSDLSESEQVESEKESEVVHQRLMYLYLMLLMMGKSHVSNHGDFDRPSAVRQAVRYKRGFGMKIHYSSCIKK
jgi:hypothetical protein